MYVIMFSITIEATSMESKKVSFRLVLTKTSLKNPFLLIAFAGPKQ